MLTRLTSLAYIAMKKVCGSITTFPMLNVSMAKASGLSSMMHCA